MTETSRVTTPLRNALLALGFSCERVNSGIVKGGKVRLWSKGSPDLIGWLPPRGRMFAIETKLGKSGLSDEQKHWRDKAERDGVLYLTAWTVTEGVQTVLSWAEAERAMG